MMGYAYVSKRVSLSVASQWVAVREGEGGGGVVLGLGVAAQRARYHMSGRWSRLVGGLREPERA